MYNSYLPKFKIPNVIWSIRFTDGQRQIAYVYFAYLYGGAIGLATLYGVKKGTQKWWEWKQERNYRKISIESVESVVNIACDGGAWAFYVMACALTNAFVAATSPISVPLLLYFFEEPKLPHTDSLSTLSTDGDYMEEISATNVDIDI